jgi:arachidonate 15-lipoxygenase
MAREEYPTVPSSPDDGTPTMQQPPKPILPQYDSAPQERQADLNKSRQAYQFDTFDFLPSLPLLKALPQSEIPPVSLFGKRAMLSTSVQTLIPITAKAWQESAAQAPPSNVPPLQAYEGLLAGLSGMKLPGYADLLAFLPPAGGNYQELEKSRPVSRPTQIIENYKKDSTFAEQRLSGVNPVVIQQLEAETLEASEVLKALLLNLPSGTEELERLSAGEPSNWYFADYHSKLPVVRGGTYKDEKGNERQKCLPRPVALFRWENNQLLPVAIQLDAHRKETIFTPSDAPIDWLLAKLCVQVADANHHELITHLCRTHLVIETIAVVTARELAQKHPLNVLLRPHFRFTLNYNDGVRNKLISPGGFIDRLLAGTLRGAEDILKEGYRTWSFDQFVFPEDIEQRGMRDIPHYPYRDDGMLVWEAIEKFVSDYLKLYYTKPEDIAKDNEVQNWAQEIRTVFEGKGFPGDFQTLDSLVRVVTSIIFIAGPQHSAINYAQYEYMAFALNMPFAAYGPLPEKGQPSQEKDIAQFLPPPLQAIGQLVTAHSLSAYQYDRLGEYLPADFTDDDVLPLIQDFKQDLVAVESKIEERNTSRPIPYPYFKPSLSLNSISI